MTNAQKKQNKLNELPPELRAQIEKLEKALRNSKGSLGRVENFFEKLCKSRLTRDDCKPVKERIAYVLPCFNPEVICCLGNNPELDIPLTYIFNKLPYELEHSFVKLVMDCREKLPADVVLEIWCRSFNDRHAVLPKPWIQCFGNGSPGELLKDQLLIDNPTVLFHYCKNKEKGWEMLRCINGKAWRTPQMPEMLREAIKNDDTDSFFIYLDLTGIKVTFSLLMVIINSQAYNIFKALLTQGYITEKNVSMGELCCHCAARLYDDEAIALLSVIEDHRPGTLKSIHDEFGRNLLWYLVFNRMTAWFHPNCKLTPFLLKHGCDPDNTNTVGFSWRYLYENMPENIKMQQMQLRIGRSSFSGSWGRKLEKLQPPEKLQNESPSERFL